MAYALYDPTKPDAAVDSGTNFGTNTRNNLLAMRDAVTMGVMPGFNFSVSGGTASQPALMFFKKGTEWIKAALTWSSGNVTVAVYSYSSNSGGAYDVIGTEITAYDGSSNVISTTWS